MVLPSQRCGRSQRREGSFFSRASGVQSRVGRNGAKGGEHASPRPRTVTGGSAASWGGRGRGRCFVSPNAGLGLMDGRTAGGSYWLTGHWRCCTICESQESAFPSAGSRFGLLLTPHFARCLNFFLPTHLTPYNTTTRHTRQSRTMAAF